MAAIHDSQLAKGLLGANHQLCYQSSALHIQVAVSVSAKQPQF